MSISLWFGIFKTKWIGRGALLEVTWIIEYIFSVTSEYFYIWYYRHTRVRKRMGQPRHCLEVRNLQSVNIIKQKICKTSKSNSRKCTYINSQNYLLHTVFNKNRNVNFKKHTDIYATRSRIVHTVFFINLRIVAPM